MSRIPPAPNEQFVALFGESPPLRQQIYAWNPAVAAPFAQFMRTLRTSSTLSDSLVEQHVHLAVNWAERAYVLAGGQIRPSGTADDLKERWADVQASYLGS